MDPQCAASTIQNYMKRYKTDCNSDGQINCLDYAAIHKLGGFGCTGDVGSKFSDTLDTCLARFNVRLRPQRQVQLPNYLQILSENRPQVSQVPQVAVPQVVVQQPGVLPSAVVQPGVQPVIGLQVVGGETGMPLVNLPYQPAQTIDLAKLPIMVFEKPVEKEKHEEPTERPKRENGNWHHGCPYDHGYGYGHRYGYGRGYYHG